MPRPAGTKLSPPEMVTRSTTLDRMSAVDAWFEGLPDEWAPVAAELRELLLSASPLMKEERKYGLPFYSHRRWMCYLSLQKHGLVLGFVAGVHMLDAEQLFATTDHKLIRHYMPPRDPSKLPLEALRRLVQEAIMLNDELALQALTKRRPRS